jgi:DNA-directed RNA polymerase specialized sigma24 family protein
MGKWTVKFLEGLARFDQEYRVRRVKRYGTTEKIADPFPPEQLVGNFLNYMRARKYHVEWEGVAKERRNAAASLHYDGRMFEIEDERERLESLEEWKRHAYASIMDAARVLQEPHRSVFRLMDIEGKSMAEAAAELGRTIDSLKHIHPAAVRMVRELVQNRV